MGKLTDKAKQLIDSKHMLWSVAVASFLESIVIPIPLEAILIPLMQAKRQKLWLIALVATLGCIVGALIGYGVGFYLFEMVGPSLVEWFSTPEQMDVIKQQIEQDGFWYILTIGIVPVPFQIAMLAAGAAGYALWLFLLATLLARSLRYFGLAVLVKLAGDQAEALFKQYKIPTIIGITTLIILIWWMT